jgi:uncharacterized repeat protein (TIGR03803 family)
VFGAAHLAPQTHNGSLIQSSSGTLYGTTAGGGWENGGVLFSSMPK